MNMKTKTLIAARNHSTTALLCLALLCLASSAFAASQIWTNAPVDQTWTNINNWVAKAVPGNINQTANNTGSGDIATFNAPIPLSGIGGASLPIRPDDATNAGRARGVSGITFDTTNCGAYVISSPTAASYPSNGVLWVSHNGTIQMTAPVTNTQTILEPMYVFLPSSTDGKYTLMNNSTNPTAALVVSSLVWAGTSGRSVNFVLDGANTANNVVTNLSNSTSTGAGGITKQGAGTWIIAGPGTQAAAKSININAGTLIIQDPGAFGLASTANVNSNGVLQINGVSPNFSSLNLKNSGTVRMNGTATINGVSVNNGAGNIPIVATTSSGDVFTLGNAVNKVTGGAADSVLSVSGPGTVYLGNDNNYVGKWSVNAGTLQIAAYSALGTGANLNIAAGATVDVTPLGSGSSWNPTTAGIGSSGTGTGVGSTAATIKADASGIVDLATGAKNISLTFKPTAFAGDSTHPALYISQGTLSAGGNYITVSNAAASPLGIGTYTLIKQASGNITDRGGYGVTVTGSGLVPNTAAIIQVSGGNLNMAVISATPNNLVWTGGSANSDWDLGLNANWLNGVTLAMFGYFDNVTFNSVGSTNPTVNLVGTLFPGSVKVDTSANDYTFAGSGKVGGAASLTKVGGGTLVVQTANSYTGGTVVSNGTFRVGIANAIPNAAGDVAVYGSGVIDLNNNNNSINGLNGTGTVDNQGGGSAILTVGYNNNSGNFTGVISNTAGTLALVKAGLGTQTLSGSNTFSGGTTLSDGGLIVKNAHALADGDLTVNSGTLDMETDLPLNSLAGAGGSIVNNSTNTTTNTLVIQGTSTTTYYGAINDGSTGKIAFRQTGAATTTIRGASSYSGGTYIGAGTVVAYTPGTLGSGTIVLDGGASGATLRIHGVGVGNTITNIGTNTLVIDSTTTIYPAFRLVGAGQFNINNSMVPGGFTPSGDWSAFSGTIVYTGTGNTRADVEPFGSSLATWDLGTAGYIVQRTVGRTVNLGALLGQSGSGLADCVFNVGALNLDTTFSGAFAGSAVLNKVGTGNLTLDNASTHTGNTTVSAGALTLTGSGSLANTPLITVANGAKFDVSALGSWTLGGTTNQTLAGNGVVLGNVTGAATVAGTSGATLVPGGDGTIGTLSLSNSLMLNDGNALAIDLSPANTVGGGTNDLIIVAGDLNLSGTSLVTFNFPTGLPAVGVPYTLIKYGGALTGGPANLAITNTHLVAVFDDSVTNKITVTFTSVTGNNLVWTGNPDATNFWDIATTVAWVAGVTPTNFLQLDNVTFDNSSTNQTVNLVGTLKPATVMFNSSSNYLFTGSGSGKLSGSASLIKAGTGTLTLTNIGVNDYFGITVVSNGILNTKSANALSANSSLEIRAAGTVQLGGYSGTVGGLSGSGTIDNNGTAAPVLTVGSLGNGVWSGTIGNSGSGGVSLVLNGTNNLTISGTNLVNSATASRINNGQGTLTLTNNGILKSGGGEIWIGCESSVTGKVVVAGGSLVVSNWLVIGRNNTNANGTLVVNSGTVQKSGSSAVNIVVGSLGATGNLTVNGGQVLNNGMLWVGEAPGAKAVVNLNGGLLQATQVRTNYNGGAPDSSVINFNGGTLQASAASANFIAVGAANVQNGGLVLDDGGYVLSIAQPLLASGTGGMVKQGAGVVYLDAANTYTGTTIVTNGTLAGSGSIAGSVVVATTGNLGAGDAGATVGKLTINNSLTLHGTATFRINKTGGVKTNDLVALGSAAANYGGTLVVSNITTDANTLAAGDTFTLFSAGSHAGIFTSIVGSPGSGLGYTFTNGVLTVVTTLNPNPPVMQFSVSGGSLYLSWPTNAGWLLQRQTNNLAGGISSTPADWETLAATASTTSTNFLVDPAKPTEFYRMIKP